MFRESGFFVHPTAIIEEPCSIGDGTAIWHYSHVSKQVEIGSKTTVGDFVFIGNRVRIGNRVKIQNHANLFSGVVIEDRCFIGPGVRFTNIRNPRAFIERKDQFQQTIVREGATIGAGCVILCGIEIAAYSFIAAGSVLTQSTKPHGLYRGNPARFRWWVCLCGSILNKTLSCPDCHRQYGEKNKQLCLIS